MAYDPLSRSTRNSRSTFFILAIVLIALEISENRETGENITIKLLNISFIFNFLILQTFLFVIITFQFIYFLVRLSEDFRYPMQPEGNSSRIEQIEKEIDKQKDAIRELEIKKAKLKTEAANYIPGQASSWPGTYELEELVQKIDFSEQKIEELSKYKTELLISPLTKVNVQVFDLAPAIVIYCACVVLFFAI